MPILNPVYCLIQTADTISTFKLHLSCNSHNDHRLIYSCYKNKTSSSVKTFCVLLSIFKIFQIYICVIFYPKKCMKFYNIFCPTYQICLLINNDSNLTIKVQTFKWLMRHKLLSISDVKRLVFCTRKKRCKQ